MDSNKKVWIRGNSKRGKEVIKMLTDLGATNPKGYEGRCEGNVYFIGKFNNISSIYDSENEFPKMIKEEYKELTLPKKEYHFEPFDKVLVREYNDDKWRAALFSHYGKVNNLYHTTDSSWKYCIPYNEETKHLLGTTDNW